MDKDNKKNKQRSCNTYAEPET